MIATKLGKKKVKMVLADGRTAKITLDYCKLVPNLWVNLFSFTHRNCSKGLEFEK
jgi:hypothetical protein